MKTPTVSSFGDDAVKSTTHIGCVIIGRNEGARLRRCIASVQRQTDGPIIYVDSGSTDGSVEYARSRGVVTVALDLTRPFTMGRARNAGFRELVSRAPETRYVQFVDGDCEVDDGWLAKAATWLATHPEVAAVCGDLRERHPDASIYNRLMDMEHRGDAGSVGACGGVAMYRAEQFANSGGFDEGMIAGEEPELCVRLRRAGYKIWRISQPMASHDANMHSFSQWWMRSVRCGHAYAEGFALQGSTKERHNLAATLRCLLSGLALPIACMTMILFASVMPGASVIPAVALALMACIWLKAAMGGYGYRQGLGDSRRDSALYAAACVVGKIPEALGVLLYLRNRLLGRRSALIEYRRLTLDGSPPR